MGLNDLLRRHARSILVLVALAFIASTWIDLVRHIYRPIWIDEFYNLLKVWSDGSLWVIQNNWLETLYLAPLRLMPKRPETALHLYRWVGLLAAPVGWWLGYQLLKKGHARSETALLSIAGVVTLGWMSSHVIVARPTAIAIGGLIIVFADNWRTRWSWVGVLIVAMQPVFLGFIVIERFTHNWRNPKVYVPVGILLVVAVSPIILARISPATFGARIIPQGEASFGVEVIALAPFKIWEWLREETRSGTLTQIVLFVLAFRYGRKRLLIAPFLYIAALFALQKFGFMVFFRYTAPVMIWLWIRIAPELELHSLPTRNVASRLPNVMLALCCIQALDRVPMALHWEATKLEDVMNTPIEPWRDLCKVKVQAESPFGFLVGLDLHLSYGRWDLDHPYDAEVKVVRCGPVIDHRWQDFMSDAEAEHFRSLYFLPIPGEDVPVLHVDRAYRATLK